MNIADYAIVSDFDGTITEADSNILLVDILGNSKNAQLEKDFIAGKMGNRETTFLHHEIFKLTLEQYHSFLDANIRVNSDFNDFLQEVCNRNISFTIVSGGFRQAISHLLGEQCLSGIQVIANELIAEDGHLKPRFVHDDIECQVSFGPCGNCKKLCLDAIRQQTNLKIIYIGDGLTDRCAAASADLTFAKGTLLEYCRENELPCVSFNTFIDIKEKLF